MRRIIVIGASPNPNRYSHKAVTALSKKDFEVYPIGIRAGTISGIDILLDRPEIVNVHTISVYLNPDNQTEYHKYFLQLKPKRVIFNPGAENDALSTILRKEGIEVLEACTLVMLSTGQF